MENSAEVKKVKKKIDKTVGATKEVTKNHQKRKKIACIATFVIGIIMLIVGATFLVISLLGSNAVADGEYLVEKKSWTLTDCGEENCDKVVWNFTEIGKGTLTTDGDEHEYSFEWAIEDGKLLIRTNWLYDLDNKYDYSLDQGGGTLTLREAGEDESDKVEYRFVAQP